MKARTLIMPTVGVLLPAALIALLLPPPHHLFELWQSLALQLLVSYVLIAIVATAWRHTRTAFVSAACAIVILLMVDPGLGDSRASQSDAETQILSIAHFNVLRSNRRFEQTVLAAQNSGADLISFQEIDAPWMQALRRGLKDSHPYEVHAYHGGNFGIAVFSRSPMEDLETHHWEGVPQITGRLRIGDSTLRFLAAHTYTPVGERSFRSRNAQLKRFARYAREQKEPFIALGDWNTVPWSRALQDFRRDSQLLDSRANVASLAATFPAGVSALGIPIDHIYHSREIACVSFSTIGGTSSDHRGLIGNYRIPECLAADQPRARSARESVLATKRN